MILSLLLIAGALGWGVAEAIALGASSIGVLDGVLGTVALFVLAGGVFALKDEPGMARPGRVGIVLTCFGALSFGMVLIIILTSGVLGAIAGGEITYGAMVWTPFYVLALLFLVGGLGGLALHYRQDRVTQAIAAACAVLALAHLARLFATEAFWFHRGTALATALLLAGLGVRRLLARRRSR